MKRTKCLACLAAVFSALSISTATGTNVEINGNSVTVTADGYATKDYFVKALSGFVYNSEEKVGAEDFARLIGITEFGEIYNGSEKLTVGQCGAGGQTYI